MKKVYISGPITGIKDLNMPAFEQAADRLRYRGFTPINPHGILAPSPELVWLDYMRADIIAMMDPELVGVCTLPDWEHSRGARVEVDLAKGLGIRCESLTWWCP